MVAAFGGRGTICAVGAWYCADADEEGANGYIIPTGLEVRGLGTEVFGHPTPNPTKLVNGFCPQPSVVAVGGLFGFGCCVCFPMASISGSVFGSFCGDVYGITQAIDLSDLEASECTALVGTVWCAAARAAGAEEKEEEEAVSLIMKLLSPNTFWLGWAWLLFFIGGPGGAEREPAYQIRAMADGANLWLLVVPDYLSRYMLRR